MATFLDPALDPPTLGSYDETRAITLDSAGRPLVESDGVKTVTKVVAEPADDFGSWSPIESGTDVPNEPADDHRVWALETATRVVSEPTDDERSLATGTSTKTVGEPTDDQRAWAESLASGLPPADDAATGLVSF